MKIVPVITTSASARTRESSGGVAQVCPAPRRGLDVQSPAARLIGPCLSEEAVFEQVWRFAIEAGRRHFLQVEVRACRELAPEVISQPHPPQRCWLVCLVVYRQEGDWAGDEVQAIVSLAEGALHLFFR